MRDFQTRAYSAGLIATLGVLLAVLTGLVIGGGAAALQFSDPGPVIRFGVPLAKALMNLSMAVSIGSLVFAAFAANDKSALLRKLLNLASAAAAVWAIAASVHFVLSFVSVSGAEFSLEQSFSQGLWVYATEIELGISLALNLLAAFAISILALSVSSLTASAFVAALGLGSLIPLALIGHAAGTANHSLAVNSLGLHLVGIVTWVGGLVAVFALKKDLLGEARPMLSRYSSLALAGFVIVAVSGIGSSYVRIPDAAGLFSPYGQLLFIKVVLLVMLGGFGAIYRTRILSKISEKGSFFKLALLEIFIMGSAIGMGTALARTAPPVSQGEFIVPSPAQLLTGEPLPPEFTMATFFTQWKLDILWGLIALWAIGAYLVAVRRLKARGDSWPVARTISWVSGMLVLIFVTSGSLNVYQEYLFSIHMVAHMFLTMAIPVLLVPGAPVTLLTLSLIHI